ncbi:MAG: RloB family protein [Bacteroides sp.]|nr:RloB family protein [Bacteroides sp.]
MISRKLCLSYYFSVEGETEKLYLERLQELINNCEKASHKVKLIIKVQKDPREAVKAFAFTHKTAAYHLCDIESGGEEHIKSFRAAIDNMRAAEKMGKHVSYRLCYSNFTFDLWIALHKLDCRAPSADRRQYLELINKGFGARFPSMNEYKKEKGFKDCLKKISLEDVAEAVNRAERIIQDKKNNGIKLEKYKNCEYYRDNPSLSVHTVIKDILEQCKV